MKTEIPPRCFRPRAYRALRRMGLARWTCVRVMWHGADLAVEATA
jgi:hypothetical protein